MTKRRQIRPKLVLDLVRAPPSPKISELLRDGTAAEVREGLGAIATLLRAAEQRQADADRFLAAVRATNDLAPGDAKELEKLVRRPLPSPVCIWLAEAFDAIAGGDDANDALGLKRRKRHGVRYAQVMRYLIADAVRQGVKREDALVLVSRLNLRELLTVRPLEEPKHLEQRLRRAISGPARPDAMKKRLQRASRAYRER